MLKAVCGYENEYMVSEDGEVFRIQENGLKKLKSVRNTNGYYRVTLSKNNQKRHVHVHRIVATAFIPNPDGFPCVNHKDENKGNNSASNLEWCTVLYNNMYNGASVKRATHLRKSIRAIKADTVLEFESTTLAGEMLGIDRPNISACLHGRRKSANGYRFEYGKE